MKSKRPRKLTYIVNQRRSVRGDKVKKTVKHYQKLVERQKVEGETKWLTNAFAVVEAKLKKYGINKDNINS